MWGWPDNDRRITTRLLKYSRNATDYNLVLWSSGCRIIAKNLRCWRERGASPFMFVVRLVASGDVDAQTSARQPTGTSGVDLVQRPSCGIRGGLLMMLWLIAFVCVYGIRVTPDKLLCFFVMSEETNHHDKDLWTYLVMHLLVLP